jgi:hypothetical protein
MTRFTFLVAIVFTAASAIAQSQPSVEPLKATVTGVEGLVQVRATESDPWKKATTGMVVGENAEFRTGPRSAVRFTIPPDQTITLDRLGVVKVLQAINDNGMIKTNLGMRYGRTRYDIEAAGREHESTISTPSSTLAVRGTKVSVFDQRPFPAEAVSLTGRAEFRDFKKRVALGGKNAGKAKVSTSDASAAAFALGESVVDPGISLARSAPETALVASLLSRGATVSFDFDKGIRVIRGGTVPQTDNELIPTLPGSLNFVLRWTANTDLNLGVFNASDANPQGNSLYPIAGLDSTPDGGRTAFDHRGGANGGMEIAFWPANFPSGVYQFGSVLITGPNTPATMDVFRDGQRVTMIGPDGNPTQTINFTAMPINPDIATGQAVGFIRIDPPAGRKSAVTATLPRQSPAGPVRKR